MGNLDKKAIEEKARELKNAYHREYYRKNKEKIKKANKRSWEKKAKQELLKKGDIK